MNEAIGISFPINKCTIYKNLFCHSTYFHIYLSQALLLLPLNINFMQIPFFKKKTEDPTKPIKKKSFLREWLDAAVFAIVAATIIRTFFIEAYTIPTPSMEKSLLVNDYLFVSKMHYGARLPMTPLAVPFVHHTMPFIGGKSYSEAIKAPYKRLWGFSSIERNDDVVFNWPADKENNRPVDKKENYIKRCVGMPGDSLEVRDRVVYINGKPGYKPKHAQFVYYVSMNPTGYDIGSEVAEDLNIYNITDQNNNPIANVYSLTDEDVANLKAIPNVVIRLADTIGGRAQKGIAQADCFPGDTTHFKWNQDNYGTIWIPKKGVSIPLTRENIALYRTVITEYEGHTLSENQYPFLIDGKPAPTYTFAMNYYWMMGDNRHNSLDSRFWGYVPEDHIVGKAWFIWMSYDKHGIRWKRLLRSVKSLED
jgi:signal peptidase I